MYKKLVVLILVLFVSSCSHLGAKKTDEEVVFERAEAWLQALLSKRVDKAWEFTSPAYRASSTPKTYFKHVAGAANWTEANVAEVACEGDRCTVRYMITYSLPQLRMQNTRPLESIWIRVNNQWWLYQR